jgi:multidrug resistance efflux pump
MSPIIDPDDAQAEIERLIAELEKAEAYEVRLRQFFVDIKAELAAGRSANAMSMLNEALRFIDDATDVVAPHRDR